MNKIIIDIDKLNTKLDFLKLPKVEILKYHDYDKWRKEFPNICDEYKYVLLTFGFGKYRVLMMYDYAPTYEAYDNPNRCN